MMERHILEIIDGKNLAALDAAELDTVKAHTAHCADCRKGYEAAQISADLLTARVALPAEPSVFFKSKVLAAIREKQNLRKPIEAFRRWWQVAYPLVCSMLFFVITLAMLTVLAPRPDSAQAASTNDSFYSPDSVILNQNSPRNLTDEQVLEVIYNERREAVVR